MSTTRTLVSVVVVIFTSTLIAAQQPGNSDADAMSRRAAERLRTLHDEAEQLASQEKSLLGELRKLEIQRQIRTEEVRQVESQSSHVATELAALDRQIATLDEEARRDVPTLRARLIGLYKLGGGGYARLLLSSDVRRFGRASRLVAELADQDRARAAAHQRRLGELSGSRRAVADRQAMLLALKKQAEQARAEADRVLATRNALIREIDQRRDLNAELVAELLTAQQKLQSAVTDLATDAAATLPIRPFRGDLQWPVSGTIRQRYGMSDARRGVNNGLDIAAAEGLPVRAVHDGTVAYADVFTGFGQLVIVDHGGQNFSLYGNLKDIGVAKGAHVLGGEAIGSVGVAPTGASGLYFELRIDGHAVDPLQWLKIR